MSLFNLEGVSKTAVDEAAVKLQPIITELKNALTESISFAGEDLVDRLQGGKITITFDFPNAKARAVAPN